MAGSQTCASAGPAEPKLRKRDPGFKMVSAGDLAEEIGQLVKCLTHRLEDLSSSPQKPQK